MLHDEGVDGAEKILTLQRAANRQVDAVVVAILMVAAQLCARRTGCPSQPPLGRRQREWCVRRIAIPTAHARFERELRNGLALQDVPHCDGDALRRAAGNHLHGGDGVAARAQEGA